MARQKAAVLLSCSKVAGAALWEWEFLSKSGRASKGSMEEVVWQAWAGLHALAWLPPWA